MDSNLFKTKSIEQLVSDVEHGDRALRRSLSAWDLTLLGIGGIIGTGIFVLTGTAAANQAGPAITMSYVAAGLACAFAALCYAEFASMIPIAGSAYTYAYATLGELVAWMIGWDLILEYAVGAMTVAIGWSGYMQQLLSGVGITLPTALSAAPPVGVINILAVLIVLVIMMLLVIGVRESARANAVMVAVKLAAVLFFLAAGATYVKPENWSPFAPFGWSGIMSAAAVVFFAYIGFDAVSTTAEEAKNPKRDLPIGIIAVAGGVHGAVSGRGRRPVGHHPRHPVPLGRRRAAGRGNGVAGGVGAVPQRSSRLRAGRDRAGLGVVPGVGGRGGRHHVGAAGDAHEPAAHLLCDEPRRPAADRRQQGASAVRDACTSRRSSPA